MKYKIVERNDGMFEVYNKTRRFGSWWYVDSFKTLESARENVAYRINKNKLNALQEYGMKIKRVVEVIKE